MSARLCSWKNCSRPYHANDLCLMHGGRRLRGTDMDRPYRGDITVTDRLWAKVEKLPGDGCWEWQAAGDGRGYGHMRINQRSEKAYRVSFALVNGPIPKGMEVCHACDNKKCVRPDHLFLGTHHENMLDAKAKGIMHPGSRNGMAKLGDAQVLDLLERATQGVRLRVEAERLGVSKECVRDIIYGRRWGHLRKPRFGAHEVERQHLGHGLYEYRLKLNGGAQ